MTSRTLAAIFLLLALPASSWAPARAGPAASTRASASTASSAPPSAASSRRRRPPRRCPPRPPARRQSPRPATTETEWGTIWDALPPSFPAFPGAQPTETGAGPATAILQLPGRADVAADWWKESLEEAGYHLEGVNGPLEDGAIVIDATGEAGCRVQTSIAPLGDVTIATIFVGSECPFR